MMLRFYMGYFLTVLCTCIHWSRVTDMDGREIQVQGQTYQYDKLMCAIECSKVPLCYSFNHDVITNRCVLYDDVITTGIYDANSKWKYYISPERPKISVPCPTGYHEVSDMCFTIYHEAGLGLEFSRLFCQNDEADLVIIDSERKQEIISPYLYQDLTYLIGLYSSYYSSIFEWVDGLTDVNYTNWATNEPNFTPSSDQWCAVIVYNTLDGKFEWKSYDCKASDAIICEITGFTPTLANV